MAYDQHLPNYRHNFETDTRFVSEYSEHYEFNFFPGSEAEKDIRHIVQTQENGYMKIIAFLGVTPPNKRIEYFFYPTEAIKTELMGDDWYAQSIYDEFRIHVLYTDKTKPIGPHEDTHLLSLPWGLAFGFLQEGLAEHMVGRAWDGTPHRIYVAEGYNKRLYPPLETFFRHEAWLETDDWYAIYFYSLAGAFSAYLIDVFGKEKYERFYKACRREYTKERHLNLFVQIFEKTIAAAETDFIAYNPPHGDA
ncbi:MAG: hypothetical protein KGI78_01360 [Patescibacteria group bacterium]|nr:hypothetical protein [Patescibacteria group bacterium]MDE1945002.1 hypothetical protein [Patescibacteria group bacterium]MDE2057482.1 hypothetical protein [Patescibacteria group bacterium]